MRQLKVCARLNAVVMDDTLAITLPDEELLLQVHLLEENKSTQMYFASGHLNCIRYEAHTSNLKVSLDKNRSAVVSVCC